MIVAANAGRPILITGGSGQVGCELTRRFKGAEFIVAPSRQELDLSNPDSIRSAVSRINPGFIINAGAYTAVDAAESDAETCMRVNSDAPAVLAEEAMKLDIPVLHYSTDYVFDGKKSSPYSEHDEPAPLNVYGRSKHTAEMNLRSIGGAWIVLRCSWVYSLTGRNFLQTMLRLREEREELAVVDDQYGSPSWAGEIASCTAAIIRMSLAAPEGCVNFLRDRSGIYHLTGEGSTSWLGFAEKIFQASKGKKPFVRGISTVDYGAPALRPRNSVLSSSKVFDTFGVRMRPWETQLAACLAERT